MTVHPYRKYSHLLLTNAWRWYLSNTTLIQIQSFTEHPNDGYIDYKSMQGLVTASSPLSWKGSYSESQFEVVGRLVTFPTCLGLGLQLLSLFLMRAPQPELSLTTPLWLLNCPQGKMTFLARLPPLGSFLLLDFSLTILGCFFVFILPLPFQLVLALPHLFLLLLIREGKHKHSQSCPWEGGFHTYSTAAEFFKQYISQFCCIILF